ncbi:hypothetical protein GCM10009122_50990 [Fulvivirga kasyanovii]|uniref:Uncharacterized protein n=1 Tax=Fulvivirga kasyanovii TaxID=396812 RepID=A0ABW9RUV3_9BACT|nr:hypothetical protein [Fulvivirga kasyanovii]MTI28012.1 hypothetical protein [Fulvivirga kasyanovii]
MRIKNIYSLISALVLVVAASATTHAQQEPKSDMPEVTINYNKKLTHTEEGVKMEKGKCIVFEIKTVHGGDPRVDAQVTTTLVFDIPEHAKTFEITGEAWKEKQAYVLISECRCMDRGYNPIISGTLKGRKSEEGQWHIEADVVAKGIDSGEDRTFKYTGVISDKK